MSEALTVSPEVVYFLILPLPKFATYRLPFPSQIKLLGSLSPDTSASFTVAPEVVYCPMVPLQEFATNTFPFPSNATLDALLKPEMKGTFTMAPEIVYSPMLLPGVWYTPPFATKKWPLPSRAMHWGQLKP